MWRSIIIIVFLCGVMAWVLVGGDNAPQRSGTLTLKPAPDFPKEQQAPLGKTMAKVLPHCPGLARFGGEVIFTALAEEGPMTKVTFTVPKEAPLPENWGRSASPCVYEVEDSVLRIAGPVCQALCLGKLPDTAQETLRVDLNPAPATGAASGAGATNAGASK